jgi:hypothetical protein
MLYDARLHEISTFSSWVSSVSSKPSEVYKICKIKLIAIQTPSQKCKDYIIFRKSNYVKYYQGFTKIVNMQNIK